jgi:hypothetical protein
MVWITRTPADDKVYATAVQAVDAPAAHWAEGTPGVEYAVTHVAATVFEELVLSHESDHWGVDPDSGVKP